ncbi:methyltransferase-domain-containing protein [Chaetomium fimeti]|uniref:Ribosomal RNA-processing protein 8 n=1 Tax=Chaetomium fimeti TaxID=1854472 RepID=A0AAE0LPB9_9PEZI|nr:methyltransferase-domain-containing protein [Chaetomium fimeti]
MFPVKGLSISAEKLKSETGVPAPSAPSAPKPKPAKKRKRPGQTGNVTAENLADLWEKVIEHKGPSVSGANKTQPRKDNKRQKKEHETAAASNPEDEDGTAQIGSKEPQNESGDKPGKKQKKKDKKEKRGSLTATTQPAEEDEDEWNGIDDEEGPSGAVQEVKEKTDRKTKKQKAGGDSKDNAKPIDKKPKSDAAAPPSAPPTSTAPKLTPLQASMREKLVSARFRHLNETLYTRPSAEAFQLFQDSPEMFTEYHEGFRRQVDVWPENPVDGYIADLKSRAKVRFQPRNPNGPVTAAQLPLPKMHSTKTCTVADLGCGDAKLATALQPVARKLHLDIRSFDLQTGGSALVTRADIANLPLADGSVDVAIFCLALMGTNWLSFVEEAYRVLRWRGELWVAEIKSRFANPAAAASHRSKVVAHSVGNRKKPSAAATKQAKAAAAEEEEEAAQLAELAVQVDGADARGGRQQQQQQQQQETDIGAFVEALRKRGFLLSRDLGEGAVDMSNRMFVRMHFVKAAPAIRGKCAAPGAEEKAASQGERKWTDGKGRTVQKKKFLDDDRDGDREGDGNEAAVLKPCVYKIR